MEHRMALLSACRDYIRVSFVASVCTVLLMLSPIIILFFASVYIYRGMVIFWKNKRYPQFGPLLEGLDSMLQFESPYFNEQRLNIGYYLNVQGRIELKEFRNVVKNGLEKFERCNESSRKLRQVITTLAGFSVGKDETNFKLQDHVRLLNLEELNERLKWQCGVNDRKVTVNKKIHKEHFTSDDLAELNGSLLRLPYKKNTSPWEILILFNPQNGSGEKSINPNSGHKNNQSVTTVVFIRICHSIADGIAINCLVSQFLDQSQNDSYGRTLQFFSTNGNKRSINQTDVKRTSTKNITDFILGLPVFISDTLTCLHENWPSIPLTQSSKYYRFSLNIQRQKIKILQDNANQRKLKSSTVFYGAAILAIRDYFKANPNKKFSTLPQIVHTPGVFGEPRRRNQLTNKFLVAGIRLPFSEESHKDSWKCLHAVEEAYMQTKKSKSLNVTRNLISLAGLLPFRLKLPFVVPWQGFALSYVPSFETSVTILGKPVVSAQGVTSAPKAPCIMIFVHESHDTFHGSVAVAQEMINCRIDAKALARTLENKLNSIYKEKAVSYG